MKLVHAARLSMDVLILDVILITLGLDHHVCDLYSDAANEFLNPVSGGAHGFEAFPLAIKCSDRGGCYTTSAERRRSREKGYGAGQPRKLTDAFNSRQKFDDIVDKCPYIQTLSNWLELSTPIAAIARWMKLK